MTRSTVPRLWFFDADEDESLGVHDVLREHNKGGASRATRIIGGTAVWWEEGSSAFQAKQKSHAAWTCRRRIGRREVMALIVSDNWGP